MKSFVSDKQPRGNRTARPAQKRSPRRGMQSLQLAVVLPILILVLIAGVQFGTTMVIQQAVTHATTVAAREAGKGADIDELAAVAEMMLFPHQMKVGPCLGIVLEDPEADVPVEHRGTVVDDLPTTPSLDPGEVRVTLCVDLSKRPFLNALKGFEMALSRSGKHFVARAVVKKECSGGNVGTDDAPCDCS